MEKELDEAVDAAKDMIINAVGTLFDEKYLTEAMDVMKRTLFLVEDNTLQYVYADGNAVAHYCIWDGCVRVKRDFIEKNKNGILLLATVIHEFSHAFSDCISEDDYFSKGNAVLKASIGDVIEESVANAFSELVINYYIKNDKEIPYITEEQRKELKEEGCFKGLEKSYEAEGRCLESILFPLHKEKEEANAIKNYIFESKSKFADSCEKILGKNIIDILDEIKRLDLSSFKSNMLEIEKEIIELLNTNTRKNEKEKFDIDENLLKVEEDSLLSYQKGYKAIEKLYYDKVIQQYFYKQNKNFDDVTEEDLQNLMKIDGDKLKSTYEEFGITKVAEALTQSWYHNNRTNLDNFKKINEVFGHISFNQFLEIIEDIKQHEEINIEKILEKYEEFNVEESPQMIEYLIDNIKTPEDISNSLFKVIEKSFSKEYRKEAEEHFYPIKDLGLTDVEDQRAFLKYMFKIGNKANLKEVLEVFNNTGILDMEMSKCTTSEKEYLEQLSRAWTSQIIRNNELQMMIDIDKGRTEENENNSSMRNSILKEVSNNNDVFLDKNANLKRFIEAISDSYINNFQKVRINVSNDNYKDIEFQFSKMPRLEILLQETSNTNGYVGIILEAFYKDLENSERFSIEQQEDCALLLNEENQKLMEISDKEKQRIITEVRNKMERYTLIENRAKLEKGIEQTERSLHSKWKSKQIQIDPIIEIQEQTR